MRSKDVRRKHRIGHVQRGQRLGDRMLAAEVLEVDIVQRLDPERNPIDARAFEAAKARGLDAGGIGLQRNLDIRGEAPMFGDGVEYRRDGGGQHQRRRAAAEKHGVHHAARRQGGAMGDFRAKGFDEAILVDIATAHVAVEIAVGAFRQAERPVHIDAEARIECGTNCRDHESLSHGAPERSRQRTRRQWFCNANITQT